MHVGTALAWQGAVALQIHACLAGSCLCQLVTRTCCLRCVVPQVTILVPNNKAWFDLMFKNGALPVDKRGKSQRCRGPRGTSCQAAGDRATVRLLVRPSQTGRLARFFLRQAGDLGPMLFQHPWPCC